MVKARVVGIFNPPASNSTEVQMSISELHDRHYSMMAVDKDEMSWYEILT